jgi:hypothetical protein
MKQKMAQRPTRQKKNDRILHKGATAAEIKCDDALAPLDGASAEMNKRWGIDRLFELVSPDSAARWGKAMAGLNAAIDTQDVDKVKFWVETCIRGLKAMDAEAVALGKPISDPMIWEHEYEGQVYGIIEDGREWPAAYAKRPGIAIHSMREVAVALHEHRNGLVNAVKLAFPGAEVKAVRRPKADLEDDFDFLSDGVIE